MKLKIDDSVLEPTDKLNPAIYFNCETGLVTRESQCSPHDGQIELGLDDGRWDCCNESDWIVCVRESLLIDYDIRIED